MGEPLTFGGRILKQMRLNGLSYGEMAAWMGCSRSAVYKWSADILPGQAALIEANKRLTVLEVYTIRRPLVPAYVRRSFRRFYITGVLNRVLPYTIFGARPPKERPYVRFHASDAEALLDGLGIGLERDRKWGS